MERHGIQNELKPKMQGYWGERIMAQILYLEEMELNGLCDANDLLNKLTLSLKTIIDKDGAVTKQTALGLEKDMSGISSKIKDITVSCIGHAHIDMNWLWGYDETVSLTIDTMRTMLMLMGEYPDLTFAQSQASVYRIIEEYAPEMLPEIKARIKEGRWEVTASTWVESDKNMINGESYTRHLLYTRRYLKELLDLTDEDFEIEFVPDTFGHCINVPEVLNTAGVKYYYHCRGYDGYSLYKWRAPSGAEITVFREPTWYNDTMTPFSFSYIPKYCADNNINRTLHVYGVGDHGGGVTRRDIESILDMNTWPCMPTIKFGKYIDFFRYIDTLELPVVEGELNFLFAGCYTSQSRIKKANRISEATLFESELLNAFSHISGGYNYNNKAFRTAWENVLFNHFHDILPGSCITESREHAMGLFQQTMAHAGTRKSAAVRSIGSMVNTASMLSDTQILKDSIAEGAGVGYGVGLTSGQFWDEGFNSVEFNYTNASTVGGRRRLFNLFNPTQVLKTSSSLITVWDWPGDISKVKVTDEKGDDVDVEVIDKEQMGYWGHEYFRMLVHCEIKPFGYRTVLLEESPTYSSGEPISWERTDDLLEYVLENELVKAVFDSMDARLISFIDKETCVEFVDKTGGGFNYILEDDSKGMTAWNIGRYMSVSPIIDDVKMTAVTGCLKKTLSFSMPIKDSKMIVTVSLDKNSRTLEYHAVCDWREFGIKSKAVPQLAFRVPLSYRCKEYINDTAFGVAVRREMDYDAPGLSFAFAPNGKRGLMLISADKYGYRCFEDSLSLNLIRSSYDPDETPECYKHRFTFGIGIIKDISPKNLIESSISFNHPTVTVATTSQVGNLGTSGNFFSIKSGEVIVSSVKIPEDSKDAVLIRVYDVSGMDGEMVLEFFKPVKSAEFVDAHEQVITCDKPLVSGNTVTACTKSNAVTAVKVCLSNGFCD